MSMLGPQGEAPAAPAGEWELLGRDMIRTKPVPKDSGGFTGGHIVAQFWTSPTPEHAALMCAAPELLAALKAAEGYLLNAKVDLETGAPKRTAINTVEGGLRIVREAIAKAEAR